MNKIIIWVMLSFCMCGCECVCMDLKSSIPETAVNSNCKVRICFEGLPYGVLEENVVERIRKNLPNVSCGDKWKLDRMEYEDDETVNVRVVVEDVEDRNSLGLFPGVFTLLVIPASVTTTHEVSIAMNACECQRSIRIQCEETVVSSMLPWAYLPMMWHDDGVPSTENYSNYSKEFAAWLSDQIADAIASMFDAAFCNEVVRLTNARIAAKRERERIEAEEEAARERAREEARAREEEEKRAEEEAHRRYLKSVEDKGNCSTSEEPFSWVDHPRLNTAYYYGGKNLYISVYEVNVIQVVNGGVLVQVDDVYRQRNYFIEGGGDGYVDGDELHHGWYLYKGIYTYGSSTVHKFRKID